MRDYTTYNSTHDYAYDYENDTSEFVFSEADVHFLMVRDGVSHEQAKHTLEDIRLIVFQSRVNRSEAEKALRDNKGNLVDAIMELTNPCSTTQPCTEEPKQT